MKLQGRHFVIPLLIASLLTSTYFLFERYRVITDYPAVTLKDDPKHPPSASDWVDTRLYFGLGPAGAPSKGVSDQAWLYFLDNEVTPRFPSGLSVLDVYGQWQGAGESEPERVRTKLLIIDYPASSDNEARIEAIREAWKKLTGDQSVLKVTQAVDISF
jgi:hypothetical protein